MCKNGEKVAKISKNPKTSLKSQKKSLKINDFEKVNDNFC